MKYFIASKRTRAIAGIGIVAISIGLISKKVINYPAGGCMKGTQELTFLYLTNNLLACSLILKSSQLC